MTDERRPQDVDRPHRRRGRPSTATRALLTDYQDAMRRELRGLLSSLEPAGGAQLGLDGKPIVTEIPLTRRAQTWDLAIKLGRELGAAIDDDGPKGAKAPRPRRGKVDFG